MPVCRLLSLLKKSVSAIVTTTIAAAVVIAAAIGSVSLLAPVCVCVSFP